MHKRAPEARIIPAWQGWHSIMHAGDMIGQQLRVYLQVMLLWMAIALILNLSSAGTLLLLLSMPLLQAGVMRMFHSQLQQASLRPVQLFDMFHDARRTQLLVAVLWLCLFIIVGVMIMFVPSAQTLRTLAAIASVEDLLAAPLPAGQLFLLISAFLVLVAVAAMLWLFAVPRIAFDQLLAHAALLESFFVCLRNWKALLTFGLAYLIIISAGLFMLGLINVLPGLLLGERAAAASTLVLTSFFSAALQVLNAGGIYLLWRKVFAHADRSDDDGTEIQAKADDGRFIA